MHENEPNIDALFFEKQKIDKNLECPACITKFQDPRVLACGHSICLPCLIREKSEKNDNFACPVCEKIDLAPYQNCPPNRIVENLLKEQAAEVYRNKKVEKLKRNLKEFYFKLENLENVLSNAPSIHQKVRENCDTLKKEIDLESEQAHDRINMFRDQYFRQIDEYEKNCLENDDDLVQTKLDIKSKLENLKAFFQNTVDYLKQRVVDDEKINSSLVELKNFKSELENYLDSFNQNEFEKSKIEFIKSKNQLEPGMLGTLKISGLKVAKNELFSNKQVFHVELNKKYEILRFELSNDSSVFVLSRCNETVYVHLFDLLSGKQINKIKMFNDNEYLSLESYKQLECLSLIDDCKLLVLAKTINEGTRIYSFDQNLSLAKSQVIQNAKRLISFATDDSKYYCLLRSFKYEDFLVIYDDKFNQIFWNENINQARLDTFYFPSTINQIKEIKVYKTNIYILTENWQAGNKSIEIMNKVNGEILRKFQITGESFTIFNDLLFSYNSNNLFSNEAIATYDLLGKKKNEIILKKNMVSSSSHFSNKSLIAYKNHHIDGVDFIIFK